MPDPAAEIESLRRQIREHDRRYYVEAAPTISDREYDELLAELRKREEANPDLVTPDSPTQRVGGEPIDGFRTVDHARRMYSIDNSYDAEDLTKWAQRCFEAVDPELAELDAKLAQLDQKEGGLKGKRDAESKKSREALASERSALLQQRIQRLDTAAEEGYPLPGGYAAAFLAADLGASHPRSLTASANRRSTGSPRACATRTASSRSALLGATVNEATTSRTTCGRSAACR